MRNLKIWFALLAFASAGSAYAADATIYFSGTFFQPSCTVDSSTVNQTITLASTPVMDFATVGSAVNPQAFSLSLTNCAAGTNVSMTMTGTASTVPSVIANTGTAAQVGVQLLLAGSIGATTGTPITLNSAVNLGAVDSTNSMTIPLVAQYYRLGTLTAGTVATTVTVSFTYN